MIIEIGHFAAIIACFIALWGSVTLALLLIRTNTNKTEISRLGVNASVLIFVLILSSWLSLTYAFLIDDFSVAYVFNNSNTLLPWYFKVSALWGAHEGSLLLWVLILAFWQALASIKSKQLPMTIRIKIMIIMNFLLFLFLSFILLTSNPFDRILPFFATEGRDLNPMLQDVGLIIHPPLLYAGYVGFAIVFAFAIASLTEEKYNNIYLRFARFWTNISWCFLTLGITLGSWWAYYTLGWGGWWFWDPVENASLMPWLTGCALLHILSISEKKGVFKNWSFLLAISTFTLSLLGTFIVRSGVVTSVHAFTSDPKRGIFILFILFVVILSSLTVFAFKGQKIKQHINFAFFSKETAVLIGSIFLVNTLFVVLTGTLYPLIIDAFLDNKISVGAPYFNELFVPLMLCVISLCLVSTFINWNKSKVNVLVKNYAINFLISLLISYVTSLITDVNAYQFVALILIFGLMLAILQDLIKKIHTQGFNVFTKLSCSFFAMHLAHFGLAICALGILLSANNIEQNVKINKENTISLKEYSIILTDNTVKQIDNYTANIVTFDIFKGTNFVDTIKAQKKFYNTRSTVMTDAAILPTLTGDLFITLGEELDAQSWSAKVQFKPFVRLIWIGAVLIALASMLAVFDKRYKIKFK